MEKKEIRKAEKKVTTSLFSLLGCTNALFNEGENQ
jgi:hypothetical protein